MSRQIAEDRGATQTHSITVDFAEGFPEVLTDESMIQQIISNLIDNAVKYTAEGSTITIGGRVEGSSAVISIQDEGQGIPENLHDKIFDRFYQVDQSSTRQVGGTGLGLYICRKLAVAVGGHLWLERSSPEGSVFSLRVPLRPIKLSGLPKVGATPALYVVEGGASATN
jgi:signal transduction histidine kinase